MYRTGTLGVTPSQKEDDPRARPSHRHRGAVRAAEAPTGSVDYLLGTGLNDFLVDRAQGEMANAPPSAYDSQAQRLWSD